MLASHQVTQKEAETILDAAAEVVYNDREKTYGHPARNFKAIANLWEAWFENTGHTIKLTPEDVAQLMILLKVARLQNQPKHRDSQIDIAGYAACMEKIQRYNSSNTSQVDPTSASPSVPIASSPSGNAPVANVKPNKTKEV